MGHLDFAGTCLLQSPGAGRSRDGPMLLKRGCHSRAHRIEQQPVALKPLPRLQKPNRVQEGVRQDAEKEGGAAIQSRVTVYEAGGVDGGVGYEPKVGDVVVGMVVSGNGSVLEVDVGARLAGVLFTRDLTPLDKVKASERRWGGSQEALEPPPIGRACIVDDGELSPHDDAPASGALMVEAGTVLQLLVIGITMSDRALLSLRNLSRPVAWQRVIEIYSIQGVVEVCVEAYNIGGLICRIEGLTAFLPKDMIQSSPRDPTRLKDYVGKRLFVMIIEVDESKYRIILNERAAWVQQLAPPDSLVEGVVTKVEEYGVIVRIAGTDLNALLHVSNMSKQGVDRIDEIFSEGESVKAVVLTPRFPDKVILSTAVLEREGRTLVDDKEELFGNAEEAYKSWRNEKRQLADDTTRPATSFNGDVEKIANLSWLHF